MVSTFAKKNPPNTPFNLFPFADPREYCISTKEFVVDDDGKLQGLNTGVSVRLIK